MRNESEGEKFFLLRLKLADYTHAHVTISPRAQITSTLADAAMRDDERRLLRLHFPNWQRPATKNLPGWRENSAVYMLWDGRLVGGMYLCAGNEVSEQPAGWGQLHYFFADPDFKAIQSFMHLIDESVRRARVWELEGIYVKTNRPKVARFFKYLNAVPCQIIEADGKAGTATQRGKASGDHKWFRLPLRLAARVNRRIATKLFLKR